MRAADCVASIERWGKRDPFGQKLMDAVDTMTADSDKTFTITLKAPFPLMLNALGKLSSNVPFMMPERLAKTDPFQQITEAIGSGPFKFVKEEWVPGSKAVFVKNTDYVPRKEPPSFAAGGKVVKVDRVEWLYIPDSATAAAALNAGEAIGASSRPPTSCRCSPPTRMSSSPRSTRSAISGVLRFNHLQPPFDNPKMREAVLNLVDQKEYMQAVAGDQKYWKTCVALFVCGTPLATDAGADDCSNGPELRQGQGADRGGRLQGREDRAARRDRSADRPCPGAGDRRGAGQGRASTSRSTPTIGAPWSPAAPRRSRSIKGGWNMFHTWTAAPDMLSPALNGPLRANGDKAWFGWPTIPKLEALIDQWFKAPDLAAQKEARRAKSRSRPTPTRSPTCRPASSSYRPPTARTSTASSSPRWSSCGTSRRNDNGAEGAMVIPAKAGIHSATAPCG